MTHPNKIPFLGTLTVIGEPSDKSPSGARGHRVILTRSAARKALRSLVGMAVNFSDEGKHNYRVKVGVIEKAKISSGAIVVEGHLWRKDFPDVVRRIETSQDLGMSYEAHDAHVEDLRAEVWTITRITFTGACILPREKAAYRASSFALLPLTGGEITEVSENVRECLVTRKDVCAS